jgi:hypothetical protein
MSLTTFRKDGRSVATPVWFAEVNGVVYVNTSPNAGKLKRIRNNSRVTVAPCNQSGKVNGPLSEGTARELTNAAEIATAYSALSKKYRVMRVVFGAIQTISNTIRRRPSNGNAYIVISAV